MTAPLTFDPPNPALAAEALFDRVWRTSLGQPGFAVVRFDAPVDSFELRQAMVMLIDALPVRFAIERLGRFDQQVSSKFHRDGAPLASLLLLGYEPTPVRSRLFIADSSRAAAEAGVSLPEFLARFNPMFPAGEAQYLPFVTEVELPHGEPYIVAINNSLLPRVEGDNNPLGVLHKAIIDSPDPTQRRVINSIGLTPGNLTRSPVVEHFLTRSDLD